MRAILGCVRTLVAVLIGFAVVCPWVRANSETKSPGKQGTYYIAADEVTWDYAPGGINRVTGQRFGDAESFWVASGPRRVGKVVKKAQYREYTDATFTQLTARPKEWEHLGLLGPLVRAEVERFLVWQHTWIDHECG